MADMAVQRDAMEAAGPYDRARALNAFKLGDVTFYWVTRACAISVLLILGGIILSAKSVRGRDASYLAPPAQIRTSGFPAYGLYGAFFVKGDTIFCALFVHSFVRPAPRAFFRPDDILRRRRAQRGSRTTLLQLAEGLSLTNASTAANCP